jgi:hypothetical protein
VEEFVFFTTFGASVAAAVLFGTAWQRSRRRLERLEDRLLTGSGAHELAELEERLNELSLRVAQLARGQEFLQQLFSGRRRLPASARHQEATPI